MALRLVIADDHLLVREGVRRLLETDSDIEVVAVCGDLESLLAAVATEHPDVVVTDIRMPPGNSDEGIQAAQRLRTTDPDVGVVVLSQYATPSYALAILEGGSAGRSYLLKERVQEPEQLVAAIRAVADGGSVIDPEVVARLLGRPRTHSPLDELTRREREILGLMAEGLSNQGIADRLGLGLKTVEGPIGQIFSKLGLEPDPDEHRRVRAVLAWLREAG